MNALFRTHVLHILHACRTQFPITRIHNVDRVHGMKTKVIPINSHHFSCISAKKAKKKKKAVFSVILK